MQKDSPKKTVKYFNHIFQSWETIKLFLNQVLLQTLTKAISRVPLGQILALSGKLSPGFVLKYVGRGVKNSFQALLAPNKNSIKKHFCHETRLPQKLTELYFILHDPKNVFVERRPQGG